MKASDLRRLTALAEARKQRDLAELEALAAEDRRLAEDIEGYARIPAEDFREAGDALPMAQLAMRLEWADRNIAIATRRRAELHRKIAHLRRRAAVSLGKHQALEKLTERSARREAERRLGREEREAPPPSPRAPGWDGEEPD